MTGLIPFPYEKYETEICAESGKDYSEVLHEQVREETLRQELYKAAGLEVPVNQPQLVPLYVAEEMSEPEEDDVVVKPTKKTPVKSNHK